jgi:hypothetical protein
MKSGVGTPTHFDTNRRASRRCRYAADLHSIEPAERNSRLPALRVNTDSPTNYGGVRQQVQYKTSMRESRTNTRQSARNKYVGAVDAATPRGHGQLLILTRELLFVTPRRSKESSVPADSDQREPASVQFSKVSVSASSRFNSIKSKSKLSALRTCVVTVTCSPTKSDSLTVS